MNKLQTLKNDATTLIGNFIAAMRVLWQGFIACPIWLRQNQAITVVKWQSGDKSWQGNRLIIREIKLPYIYVEDPRWSEMFDSFKRIDLDLRVVTVKKF